MYKYIIILTIFFVHTLHSEAHDELQKHDLCSRALDYYGCIKNNSNYTIENFGEWRRYGSLNINWSRWRSRGDNHIVPAINSSKKPIYLAINCDKLTINTTGSETVWKGWLPATQDFEKNLLNDYCNKSENGN